MEWICGMCEGLLTTDHHRIVLHLPYLLDPYKSHSLLSCIMWDELWWWEKSIDNNIVHYSLRIFSNLSPHFELAWRALPYNNTEAVYINFRTYVSVNWYPKLLVKVNALILNQNIKIWRYKEGNVITYLIK